MKRKNCPLPTRQKINRLTARLANRDATIKRLQAEVEEANELIDRQDYELYLLDNIRQGMVQSRVKWMMRMKRYVPHPSLLSGWDDRSVPRDVAEAIIEACAVHGTDIPKHIREAAEAAEGGADAT